jgi:hypothetical protein
VRERNQLARALSTVGVLANRANSAVVAGDLRAYRECMLELRDVINDAIG